MVHVFTPVLTHYDPADNVYVGLDLLIYYQQGNNKRRVAPDVFVAWGVPKRSRAPTRSEKKASRRISCWRWRRRAPPATAATTNWTCTPGSACGSTGCSTRRRPARAKVAGLRLGGRPVPAVAGPEAGRSQAGGLEPRAGLGVALQSGAVAPLGSDEGAIPPEPYRGKQGAAGRRKPHSGRGRCPAGGRETRSGTGGGLGSLAATQRIDSVQRIPGGIAAKNSQAHECPAGWHRRIAGPHRS